MLTTSVALRAMLASTILVLSSSGTLAANLDLNDCKVLMGQKSVKAYQGWLNQQRKEAAQGHLEALRMLAAEANNRFVCHEEAVLGDQGWGITIESQGVTESKEPSGIAQIQGKPQAFEALKEAVSRAHQAGQYDPGYRAISASLVAKYKQALPDQIESAYEDIAGNYEFDCVLKRQYGKRNSKSACVMARSTKAQLFQSIGDARRAQLDTAGRRWAETLSTDTATP